MCERYFVTFPAKPAKSRAYVLNKALKNFQASEVKLHNKVFFRPLRPNENNKKLCQEQIVRQNILYMSKLTNHFGLLLTQFHWMELLTLAQGRIIMSENGYVLQCIKMYRMLLKKDSSYFNKFINALHMTGNHQVANLLENRVNQIQLSDNQEESQPEVLDPKTSNISSVESNFIENEIFTNPAINGSTTVTKFHNVSESVKPLEAISKNNNNQTKPKVVNSRAPRGTLSRLMNHFKRTNPTQLSKASKNMMFQ